MSKKITKIAGIFFILIGIFGFIPVIAEKNYLFGIFRTNTFLNILHLTTGICAWWASRVGQTAARLFCQFFGILYTALAMMGFSYNNKNLFILIANNYPDAWLHLVAGILFLYLGFLHKIR